MKMKCTSLIFMVVLLFSGCGHSPQSANQPSMQSLDKNAIVVGSGGGFSGFYDGYIITRGGDVFSWKGISNTPDSLALLFHTTKDSVDFFFRFLDEIHFSDILLQSSGNMNSFIEERIGEMKHRLQWGENTSSVPPEVLTFYSLVLKYCQRGRNLHKQ
jgi:hypothetical protein